LIDDDIGHRQGFLSSVTSDAVLEVISKQCHLVAIQIRFDEGYGMIMKANPLERLISGLEAPA
jgi:hypothetical protein